MKFRFENRKREAVLRHCFVLLLYLVCCFQAFRGTAFAESGADSDSEEEDIYYSFTTMEEMLDLLAGYSGEQMWLIDVGEDDHMIDKDLTIPDECYLFFGPGTVTVAPDTVVTIERKGSIFLTNLMLRGEIVNHGSLSQTAESEDNPGLLRLEGKLVNDGWFSYLRAQDLSNVENTDRGRVYTENGQDEPEPDPSPEPVAGPKEPDRTGSYRLLSLRMKLQRALFRLRILYLRNEEWLGRVLSLALVVIVMVLSSRVAKKRKSRMSGDPDAFPGRSRGGMNAETRGARGTAAVRPAFGERTETETMFSDDQEKRMAHLDDWLKSGLIDRKEYNVLKEHYRRRQ